MMLFLCVWALTGIVFYDEMSYHSLHLCCIGVWCVDDLCFLFGVRYDISETQRNSSVGHSS